jgi:hypothetical protein
VRSSASSEGVDDLFGLFDVTLTRLEEIAR